MAHWSHTLCKSENEDCSHFSSSNESRNDGHGSKKHRLLDGPEVPSEISKHSKVFGPVAEIRTTNIIDEKLTETSKKMRIERMNLQPFPMYKAAIDCSGAGKSQIGLDSSSNNPCLGTTSSHFPSKLELVAEGGTKPREFTFKGKDIERGYQEQQENINSSLAVSTFIRDRFMGSAPKSRPLEICSSGIPLHSSMFGEDNGNQSNPCMASKQHVENSKSHSYSTFMVQKTKVNNLLDSISADRLSRQNIMNLSLHDTSTSNYQKPEFVHIPSDTKQNHSGIRLFNSQSNPTIATRLGKLQGRVYTQPRLPYSVHDVETMRICTTVDSVEESSRGHPKFSQTTHHFLITKNTDLSLSEGGQIFGESALSTKLKGKALSGLLGLSGHLGIHDQQRSRSLGPLGSSMEGEGGENFGDVRTSAVCLSNGSSDETDIMDMDALHENRLSGMEMSPLYKGFKRNQMSLSKHVIPSTREESGEEDLLKKALPDMNQKLPNTPALTSSMNNNLETSTSKTQSLDADHLLSHTIKPKYSNSTAFLDEPLRSEPSNGQTKSLKQSASATGYATKNSKMREDSSSMQATQFRTSLEPTVSNLHHGKEQMRFDETKAMVRNQNSSRSNLERQSRDTMLSHPWIKRWCHNPPAASQTKLDSMVVFDPKSSKLAFDEFQQRPFPSIAAMALMGKAMTGFRQCEFTRKGSFLVWNTEG